MSIGNFVSKFTNIARTVGNGVAAAGKGAGGIATIANTALPFVPKSVSEVMSSVAKFIDAKVGNLPSASQSPGVLFSTVTKLLDQGATALMGKAPLGGVGVLAQKASTVGDLANVAQAVQKAANTVGALKSSPLAFPNVQHLLAHAQAHKLQ